MANILLILQILKAIAEIYAQIKKEKGNADAINYLKNVAGAFKQMASKKPEDRAMAAKSFDNLWKSM